MKEKELIGIIRIWTICKKAQYADDVTKKRTYKVDKGFNNHHNEYQTRSNGYKIDDETNKCIYCKNGIDNIKRRCANCFESGQMNWQRKLQMSYTWWECFEESTYNAIPFGFKSF